MSIYDYLGNIIIDTDTQIPQMYGAKGDGITDDYNAIASAIEANKGGTLYFPKGTYKISSPIKTYPSDQNFTHLIFHPQANIVPSSQMDYLIDIGGISETWNRQIGANSRKKILCGGVLIANNGNVNIAAVHISNNTADVDMSFMDIHTKDCSCLLLGDSTGTVKSTDCYVHNCNMCHDNAENQVSGIIVRSYDNNFSDLRINFHKIGMEIYGGGQYIDNVHTLATNKQSDGISFLTHNASVHFVHCYGDSEGTFLKAESNALVDMIDCQYYSYWGHNVVFFDLSGTAKIKVRGLTLDCIANYTNIGTKTPYASFASQFNDKNFDVNGVVIGNSQYLRDGDPLKGTQNVGCKNAFAQTAMTQGTWYELGNFAVDTASWNNIEVIINNRYTRIPVSVQCSNEGALTLNIGSGNLITDDSGSYQLGFSVLNSGFDASTDYARIGVYLKPNNTGKTIQSITLLTNQSNPISTHSADPSSALRTYSGTPSTIVNVNCDNKTVTSV